jgi:hypothetical protein
MSYIKSKFCLKSSHYSPTKKNSRQSSKPQDLTKSPPIKGGGGAHVPMLPFEAPKKVLFPPPFLFTPFKPPNPLMILLKRKTNYKYYFHFATPFIENTKLRAYMYTMEAFPSRQRFLKRYFVLMQKTMVLIK